MTRFGYGSNESISCVDGFASHRSGVRRRFRTEKVNDGGGDAHGNRNRVDRSRKAVGKGGKFVGETLPVAVEIVDDLLNSDALGLEFL